MPIPKVYISILMASTLESNTWTTSNTYGTFLYINTIKTLVHRGLSLVTKNILRGMYPYEDESSRRDHVLEACHPYGVHGYMKICHTKYSHILKYGEQSARLNQSSAIKKGIASWCGKKCHHLII
jgi:hypothetical protein